MARNSAPAVVGLFVAATISAQPPAGPVQSAQDLAPPRGRRFVPYEPPAPVPTQWQLIEALPAPVAKPSADDPVVDVAAEANRVGPGPGDLDPTIDVQITQDIVDKANELGSATAMYEFVRNECAFQTYFGSQKGSVETLRQRAGNDYDLASLLIALLRASNIPARYAVGMVEMPADRAATWLGVADPEVAGSILFTHGLEGINVIDGMSNVIAVRARRVWVEAFVSSGHGAPAWVPLDPSFKQLDVFPGQDIPDAMSLDAQAFVDGYWNPMPPVPLPRPETVLEILEQDVQAWLDTNLPGTTVEEVERSSEIEPEVLGLLPLSLPYTVRSRDTQYSEVPANRRYQIRFHLYDGGTTLIDHTLNLPEVAGRRITIDYVGATPGDQATIDSNGGIYQTPPNTVTLTPVLRLEGTDLVTGSSTGVGMGRIHGSDVHFLAPTNGSGLPVNVVPTIFNTMIAGAAEAHALSIEGTAEGLLTAPSDDTEGMAPLLWNIGMDYVSRVRHADLKLGQLLHGYVTTGVTNAIVSNVVKVTTDGGGNPITFDWGGLVVDADRAVLGYWPVDGLQPSNLEPKDFLVIGGAEGSLLESMIYEDDFGQDSVSTIKLLQLAIDDGVTVYERWGSLPLPANTQPAAVQNALANAILAGHEVTFPADPMTIGTPSTGEWTGTAWIDMNPANGAAGYIIAGGLNGGATVETWPPEFVDLTEDDKSIVMVEVLMKGGVSPVGDSPAPESVYTRDNEENLEFEYQIKVTYDDASTKTLPSASTYYKRTTRNTTKTFVPGNYTFQVWVARRLWWLNLTIATAVRKVSIVGVLIREDDGTTAGKDPPESIQTLPPAPEDPPFFNLKALVIPEKAPDGVTDLASSFTWTVGPRLRWLIVQPGNQIVRLEPKDATPSAAEDDQPVDVTVDLPGGKQQKGFAKFVFAPGGQDEKHEMTVVAVDLDAMKIDDNAPNGELEDTRELDPGSFVPRNDDDDDYDAANTPDVNQAGSIAGESDLMPILLHKIVPAIGGKYTLDIPTQVKIWKMANRSDAVSGTTEFDADMDTTLYVEGVSTGSGEIKLDWKKGTKEIDDADRVKGTVFGWSGPLNVPGYSIYRYVVTGAPAGAAWTAPDDGAIQTGAGTNDVTILWGAGPVVGKAIYQVNPDFVWDLEVNVVQIEISATNNSASYPGTTHHRSAGSRLWATNAPGGGSGMTANFRVSRIEGPMNRGVKFMEMGQVHQARHPVMRALYDGTAMKRVCKLEGYLGGSWLWDPAAAATVPWTFMNATHYLDPTVDGTLTNKDFSTFDGPTVWITDMVVFGGDTIDRSECTMSHRLYFAVRTQVPDVNGSADVLTQRLVLNWSVTADGDWAAGPPGVWTYTGAGTGVSGDAMWAEVTSGATVPVPATATIYNTLVNDPAIGAGGWTASAQ